MMKKVLLISNYPPPSGGIAAWTKRLLEIGLPDDWEIEHINSNMIGGRDSFKNTKINLFHEGKRCFSIWSKEIHALRSDKAHCIPVVHTCIPCALTGMIREIITGIIAKAYGRSFLVHCRCTVPNVVTGGLKKAVFKLLSNLCDGVIVLNEKSYRFVRQIVRDSCYVECIPNFAAEEEFVHGDREYREAASDYLYVGGVVAEKGCDLILDTAEELPDLTFHLVGAIGPEIQNRTIPGNVKLYGNRDKAFIREMMLRSDAFLFLSRFWGEGFSNALVEAMSAGLPCIVSDWAANADMIGADGGIVLSECCKEELLKAMKQIEDRESRKQMGQRNIQKAYLDYSEKTILPRYVRFYETIKK